MGWMAVAKKWAEDLGTPPSVTGGSYISPFFFDRSRGGKVLADYDPRAGRLPAELEGLSRSEAALKRLLESEKELKVGRGKGARAVSLFSVAIASALPLASIASS